MARANLREQIINLFLTRGDVFLSGEQISAELGVSRAAVWKHIDQLRRVGYEIEAQPSRGYHLLRRPDLLLPEMVRCDLNTACIGCEVHYFASTDSTNVRAGELGDSGAPEGTVVVAESQSAGRGRMGRSWISPAGVNLYTSVLLRPQILPLQASQLTFMAAVAVARAVEAVTELPVTVKWPNDILINGKKVAGLLNEVSAEMEGIHYVVLGIGININMDSGQFPADLRYPATSLMLELGASVERVELARELYRQLDSLYRLYCERGFAPVRLAWEALFAMLGCEVAVDCGGQEFRGVVGGINGDGALLLNLADGAVQEIYAGDVTPL